MAPTPDEVRHQLERVLASDAFASASRLGRFLRHVVERSLAGDGERLKEYAIGLEVFDRGEDYDPRLDSIVRVEAARVRNKLTGYYAGPGASDPVVIRMPRGSYAPVFEDRPNGSAAAVEAAPSSSEPASAATVRSARWRPALAGLLAAVLLGGALTWRTRLTSGAHASAVTVAVLPFAHYSSDPAEERLAARLTDGVTSELARTGAVAVVSHTSALQFTGARRPAKEIARALDANVLMEATVTTEGERVRVRARLVDAARDRKVWVDDFVGSASDPLELERRIAAGVAAASRARRR